MTCVDQSTFLLLLIKVIIMFFTILPVWQAVIKRLKKKTKDFEKTRAGKAKRRERRERG